MTKRIRRYAAGLGIAAAAALGLATADTFIAPPDTTWGAPTDENDTTWGTAPANPGDDPTGPVVTPQDTTWG